MPRRVMRNRLLPYRVLVYLLYGQQPWLERLGDDRVLIKTGPMARSLRTSVTKLREHLDWLKAFGYLENVETAKRGCEIASLRLPDASQDISNG